MKTCTRCRVTKDLEQFPRLAHTSDGRSSWCRQCTNAHSRAKYIENHEAELERSRAYRAAHADEISEYNKRYRTEHADQERAAKRRREARRRARLAANLVLPFSEDDLARRLSMFAGCWVCGGEATQVDHVKPIAAGGAHILANLRPICGQCNQRKKDKWPYALARPVL